MQPAKEQGLLTGNKRESGANQGRLRLVGLFLGQGFYVQKPRRVTHRGVRV